MGETNFIEPLGCLLIYSLPHHTNGMSRRGVRRQYSA